MSNSCQKFVFGRSSKRYINIKSLKKNSSVNSYCLKNSNNAKRTISKLKGATVNVPVDVSKTTKKLMY